MDLERAKSDAKKLYNAGERRPGTDESVFNTILTSESFAQLCAIFDEYKTLSHHSIEHAIESEFSGAIKDALNAIVKCAKNRPAFFVVCLLNAVKVMRIHKIK